MNPNSRAMYTGYVCRTNAKGSVTSTPKTKPAPVNTTESPATDPAKYNAPEYYSYSEYSYYDIDRECISMRIPQPQAPIEHR